MRCELVFPPEAGNSRKSLILLNAVMVGGTISQKQWVISAGLSVSANGNPSSNGSNSGVRVRVEVNEVRVQECRMHVQDAVVISRVNAKGSVSGSPLISCNCTCEV